MQTWDSQLPIYQQLADLLAERLLEGDPPEGEPMPSVRALAGHWWRRGAAWGTSFAAVRAFACATPSARAFSTSNGRGCVSGWHGLA